MNIKKYSFLLLAALVACSTMLLSAMPALADDSNLGITTMGTPGEYPKPPALLPPLTPTSLTPPSSPSHPPTYDNTYPPRPPRPRPPTPPYPQPTWPYNGYNNWSNYYAVNPDYYSPPVIIYQQAQPTYYAPVISSFAANPSYIQLGQTATLAWTVSNADTVTISPSIGSVANTGTFTVMPDTTTTYTLIAASNGGTVSASTTVTVAPYVSSIYGTGSSAGTVAVASTGNYSGVAPATDAGSAVITSGVSSGSNTSGNTGLMYLLVSLLALAAGVIVFLMVRKPAVAHARGRTGPATGYLATSAAPAATLPATGIATATSMETTLPAKLVSPGGTVMPVTGQPMGRRDFQAVMPTEKADLISRQHMKITYENSEYRIEDLNSTNGTRLNGSEIRGSGRHTIANGDSVEIAGVLNLTFKV